MLHLASSRQIRNALLGFCSPWLKKHQRIQQILRELDVNSDLLRHSVAAVLPQVIQPDPREIYITLTANCNLRCIGCRYGRDFMPGEQLPWPLVRSLLDDCRSAGIRSIRFYGGEPLLHKDVVRMVEYTSTLGLQPWLTTNGILLKEKIDDLYRAGLRDLSVGSYGTGAEYDRYVQRPGQYARMEAGIAYLRDRYGLNVKIVLGWVLMRPTCSIAAVEELWKFAERYQAAIGVSLVHYSLPYFTEGPDRQLQFRPEDREAIETVVGKLLALKKDRPELLPQSERSLRSIPDWLIQGPAMRVPCDRYRLIWVGADGTVQMCYVTFRLGNLHQKRLSDMLFTAEHRAAARSAFAVQCPNCHCSYHNRIEMHAPSRWKYSGN